MRLSSISFTHSSTAIFGLAVAVYAAVRLAGYDAPHLPGHLALPEPPLTQRVPETGQSASRSAQQVTGFVGDVTRHPDTGDDLQTHPTAETQNPIARTTEIADSSVTGGREWREDSPRVEATDAEQPDTAPSDDPAGDPSPSTTSDDSADTPRDTTADEEAATASDDDVEHDRDDDDEPADR
jgi:hypothetical protein